MTSPRWQLYRQDDNGNRYLMTTFDDDVAAHAQALVSTARGHHQLYTVDGPAGPAVRTSADLYQLCRRIPTVAGDRDLSTYLRSLYRLGPAVADLQTLAPHTFAALLLAAATAEPAPAEDPPDARTAYFGLPCRHPDHRIPTTADAEPPPAELLPPLTWDRLIEFAWAGQSYE